MAIEIQPESAQHPGGHEPGAAPKARPWWMRPGFHTALVGAVVGYLIGHWLGSFLAGGYQAVPLNDNDDFSIVIGYAFGILGWLIGLGVFNDLYRQMLGRPVRHAEEDHTVGGLAKYFRYSLDHKVVGLQYLFAMVASGKIRIDVTAEYALRDAARAHADLELRKTVGAVVLVA